MSEMIYALQFMNTALPSVASNILDFPVGKQHLYSAVWWGLENKDWSLLCILSWSLSLKWIRLTSTSRGLVCQEALSYSCSTMPLPQSKFSWMAARESAPRAGQDLTRRCARLQSTSTFSLLYESKSTLFTHPWHKKTIHYVCRGLRGVLIKPYWFPLFLWCWDLLFRGPCFVRKTPPPVSWSCYHSLTDVQFTCVTLWV